MANPIKTLAVLLPLLLLFVKTVNGHGGHADLPEGEVMTAEPLVSSCSLRLLDQSTNTGLIYAVRTRRYGSILSS